jgi:hypothetical protein
MLREGERQYFEALQHGFESLLPLCRVQNRAFLFSLLKAIEQETSLTKPEQAHLKTLMIMTDAVTFPDIKDPKSYAAAEAYLIRAYPQFPKRKSAIPWSGPFCS